MNYAGFSKIEIVIVTLHLFRCCSTIKIRFRYSLRFRVGNLSVALLHFVIHCSVFKVPSLPASFEARSQSPKPWALRSISKSCLVGPSGLEPPTLRLSVARSSQLSYGPLSSEETSSSFIFKHFIGLKMNLDDGYVMNLVENNGIEPLTS